MNPTRTETVEERWKRLRTLTSVSGWDGPRSIIVTSATWDRAQELARVVASETGCTVAPFVSASGSGSVYLRWGQAPGAVIDVEIMADGDVEWELQSAAGYESGEHDRGAIVQRIRENLCAA